MLGGPFDHIDLGNHDHHWYLQDLGYRIILFLNFSEVNVRINDEHVIVRVQAHKTKNRVLHLVIISAQIDHLDYLGTLLGYLSLYLLALRRIIVVNVMPASDLLQVLVESDDLMLGQSRLSAYLLALLTKNFVTQGPLAIVLDSSWGRKEFAQRCFPAIKVSSERHSNSLLSF